MPINRRSFLSNAAKSAGALYLQPRWKPIGEAIQLPAPLQLKMMATNWGIPGSLNQFCGMAREAGYDGIEQWVPRDAEGRKALRQATEEHGLAFGFLAGSGASDFEEHFSQFRDAVRTGISMNPLYINCHSGRDYFTYEQNRQLVAFTLEQSVASGIPIYHETHRARMLFSSVITERMLEEFPDLRLTLDISHWCCVHGSMLEDQKERVAKALEHSGHIHARVGHRNGPQVTDPAAPEWERETNIHLAWWDTIARRKAAAGETLTITTEFGPPTYMPTLPYTNQPVVDLWGVNVAMQKRLRQRYAGSSF